MEQNSLDEQVNNRRVWREIDIMARLQSGEINLPPTTLRLVENSSQVFSSTRSSHSSFADGILEVAYRGRSQKYIVEVKNRSTPQVLQNAILQIQHLAASTNLLPLVIMPYLSDESLTFLEEKEVSGVDLSGNGVILAPDFTVRRSGQPNRYREVQSVRNLYRGISSIFVRCFLLRAEYASLKELREYALSCLDQEETQPISETKLAMSTASKVIQQLQEEMLVQRDGHRLHTIDTSRLMDGLRTNYRPPHGARITGKTMVSENEIWQRLAERRSAKADTSIKWRYAATGLGSAGKYGVLSGPDKLSLYVSDIDRAADLVEVRATRVFPNLELIEDKDDTVYFDARRDGAKIWASPIQTWLELKAGGPREREAAQTLESALIKSRGEQIS